MEGQDRSVPQENWRNVGLIQCEQCMLESCLKPWLAAPSPTTSKTLGTGAIYKWQDYMIHVGIAPKTRNELRIYDGTVVAVDGITGVSRETREFILRAAQEGIRTVFVITKLEKLLESGRNVMEQSITTLLSAIQVIANVCNSSNYPISPEAGTVLLASSTLDYSVACTQFTSVKDLCAQLIDPPPSYLLPLGEALFRMIRDYLPSPCRSAMPRFIRPLGTEEALICGSEGPLCLYIAKVVIGHREKYAVGRVFAGTIEKDRAVYVAQKDNIEYGPVTTYHSTNNTEEGLMPCSSFPPGSILTMQVTSDLIHTGTILTDSYTIKYAVEPLEKVPKTVRAAVEPAKASDLPKLINALGTLRFKCPYTSVNSFEPREIQATDTKSLLSAVSHLRSILSPSLLVQGDIMPIYRETIQAASSDVYLTKSPNKHIRLYCSAEPLSEAYISSMETTQQDAKTRMKTIWQSSAEGNEMIDSTVAVQYLNEIVGHISSGFQYFCSSGALCDEPVRGVRVMLRDVCMCVDAIHRGGGQVIPTIRRLCFGCQLMSQPALLEPILRAEIVIPAEDSELICTLLAAHRGYVLSTESLPGSLLSRLTAAIPATQTDSLEASIKGICNGLGSLDLDTGYWTVIPGNPMDPESESGRIVKDIRERKGLRLDFPSADCYLDRV